MGTFSCQIDNIVLIILQFLGLLYRKWMPTIILDNKLEIKKIKFTALSQNQSGTYNYIPLRIQLHFFFRIA